MKEVKLKKYNYKPNINVDSLVMMIFKLKEDCADKDAKVFLVANQYELQEITNDLIDFTPEEKADYNNLYNAINGVVGHFLDCVIIRSDNIRGIVLLTNPKDLDVFNASCSWGCLSSFANSESIIHMYS